MNTKQIAVILPSRGLIFAEVEDSITRNLEPYDYTVYRSWDLVIPDSVNVLVDKALIRNPDFVFFIEEDTVIPDGGIEKLIQANADIACIDYGVAGWGCVTKDQSGDVLWCGLGCTLVKPYVFDKIERPYFRSDIELRLNDWTWVPSPPNKYGGQDIYFCCKARENGFKIKEIEGMECKHLRLEALGKPEINRGLHTIVQKPVITNHQTL